MKRILSIFLIMFFLLTLWHSSEAQVNRVSQVGRLLWGLDVIGTTWVSSPTSTGQYGPALWYNWEPWPSFENDIGYHGVDVNAGGHLDGHGKDMAGNYDWWVGSTNWTAPPAGSWGPNGAEAVYTPGITYDVFVSDNGPVTLNSLINTPAEGWSAPKYVRRVDMPVMSIDGVSQQPIAFDPIGNPYTVDPNLTTDARLEAMWHDPMGLTFHEFRYTYSHPDYDEMMLCEVTITNSGEANATLPGLEKPNQTLTDFWVGVTHNLGDTRNTNFGSFGWYNGEVDWLLDYDPATRYYWTWDGDAADIPGDDQFDPRGGPNGTADIPTGEFTAPEVNGFAFLYVSGTPGGDDSADQPATFRFKQYQDVKSPVQGDDMTEAWNWMTGADGAPMYQKGFSDDPYQTVPIGQPHYQPIFGCGPYTLAPNDQIKLVYVFASGSISEARAIELGDMVKKGQISLADAKKEIYEKGRDDLFAKFERAKDLYFNKNLVAPLLPDPPTNIVMKSGPELATLTWDAVPGVDGYRIYRATGGIDNGRVYRLIKETTETSYTDEGLTRGTFYFYNIVSVKGDLESNPFFTRVNKEVVPFRAPPSTEAWKEMVRVVPNPINVKGNTYKEDAAHNTTGFNFDGGTREQNTMLFVNIPAQCTIRIYDSAGLLIKTLEHTSGTADERWSPIISDDNLTPASGIYFYTIEAHNAPLEGQIATGKLVIVR